MSLARTLAGGTYLCLAIPAASSPNEFWAPLRPSKAASYRVSDSTCSGIASDYTCTVTVRALGKMRMPVSVLVRFQDGSEQRARTDRLADVDVLSFRARTPLKDVVIEPDSAIALVAAP